MNRLTLWIFALFVITTICLGYSSKPPSHTGAQGVPDRGESCTSCHGSSETGSLVISNLPDRYKVSQRYTVKVELSQKGRERWGFAMTALDASGNRAGTFENIDGNTQVFNSSGRQYIGHTSSGTAAGQLDNNIWVVHWTAPNNDKGKITFYASGNAADNSGDTTGDSGYKIQVIIKPETNNPPTCYPETISTYQEKPVSIKLQTSDIDNDALIYEIVRPPGHGNLSGTAPNLTYTPDAGYVGNDSFRFRANDGKINSNRCTVSLTINSIGVNIPDPNLRGALEKALGKNEGDAITKEDLEGLTELTYEARDGNKTSNLIAISNLTGIEHCSELEKLHLNFNLVTDITPIQNLTKLSYLSLYVNPISDITPLSNLNNLTKLQLNTADQGNGISDVRPLKNLTKLSYLDLSNNQISDISSLKNLSELTNLILYNNLIEDLTTISSLVNLEILTLSSNKISDADLSVLTNLKSLTQLRVGNNQLADISILSNLPNLTELWLYDNQIEDISALNILTSLRILDVNGNSKIKDISPIAR